MENTTSTRPNGVQWCSAAKAVEPDHTYEACAKCGRLVVVKSGRVGRHLSNLNERGGATR